MGLVCVWLQEKLLEDEKHVQDVFREVNGTFFDAPFRRVLAANVAMRPERRGSCYLAGLRRPEGLNCLFRLLLGTLKLMLMVAIASLLHTAQLNCR
jgi:hypothetical protein